MVPVETEGSTVQFTSSEAISTDNVPLRAKNGARITRRVTGIWAFQPVPTGPEVGEQGVRGASGTLASFFFHAASQPPAEGLAQVTGEEEQSKARNC